MQTNGTSRQFKVVETGTFLLLRKALPNANSARSMRAEIVAWQQASGKKVRRVGGMPDLLVARGLLPELLKEDYIPFDNGDALFPVTPVSVQYGRQVVKVKGAPSIVVIEALEWGLDRGLRTELVRGNLWDPYRSQYPKFGEGHVKVSLSQLPMPHLLRRGVTGLLELVK